MQDTVQGGRRPGKQRKRWDDNIKEWDRPFVERHLEKSGTQRRVEQFGDENIHGAPRANKIPDDDDEAEITLEAAVHVSNNTCFGTLSSLWCGSTPSRLRFSSNILCVLQLGLTSVALLDKGKGIAIP
ncbi:hypothetical protein PoB_004055800 [Plakobranchus ocellatus]|uniref:Ribosome biogenesis protein NOP53 n=1 Tax=Plakobranchus ocellatus TaxID=259542 RepID=A0AAV4B5L2_9GAST|nr:hypothetical protein PoB_004055800 [Plakobranchus ocellatus]